MGQQPHPSSGEADGADPPPIAAAAARLGTSEPGPRASMPSAVVVVAQPVGGPSSHHVAATATDGPPGTDSAADSGSAPEETDDALGGHVVALLFAADEALPVAEVARILNVRASRVEVALARLAARPPVGLLVQRDGDRVQLATSPASARYIRRLRGLEERARLSRAALEVLAVIAYRQPVTRAEVEAIRGVNGDRALSTLLARGLVADVGRRETVGRPVLFGTTLGFLEHLGLQSLADLPPARSVEATPGSG